MHRKPCLVILCCMVAAGLTVSSWTPSVPCPDHALANATQVDDGVAEGVGPTPHRTVGYTEPQVGDQFSYQFVLRQSSEVGGSGESLAPESVAATIRGSFSDTLCAVTEEGHVYEVAVTHLVVEQGGATVPLAVQGKALRVLKGPDGLVVGYGTGVDEHARLPRMLFLRVHQVPVQGSGRITAEDETGRCDFEYDSAAADNGRRIVTRKKERIVPIRASEVPTSIEIRASNDRVEQEDGRTMKAVCHEVLAIDAGGIPVVAVLDLEAECVARTRVDVEPGVPSQFTTWPRLAPAEEARTPPTLDEALVELRGLEAKDELGSIAMHRVFAGLVERLASDPSAVDDLVQRLLGGEVAPPHLSLDLAGLLVSALADAAAAGGTRAVESVGQLVQRLPSGELLGALGRALHQLGGLPPEVVGPVLAVTTERLRFLPPEEDPAGDLAIALGGLMRTVGAGTEEARHALAVLRERAAGNGNPGRLVTALAESRDVELIRTEVLPLASHGDGGVRLRVMEALAVCANDPESRRALLRAAEGDSDADVRIAAAGSLASSGTADARRILIRMATSDPDVSVRVAALHLLARGRDAEVLAVLGRAASQDPDSEVRRIAAELARGS